jgi:hypothetical protein
MKSLMALMLSLLCLAFASHALAQGEPQLSITNAPPDFVVSWPDLPSWVLEQSPHLRPPVPWSLVEPELYQSAGGVRFLNVSTGNSNRFFRLRKETTLTVPGLAGYFAFEEGAGAVSRDGSGSGTAMLLTNVSWAPGRIGVGALQFNGLGGANGSRASVSNDDYRVLPASGQPFSVSLWLNPDDLAIGWRGLVGNDAAGTNGWHAALNSTGPGTNYIVFASDSLSVTGRMLLLPGQWHQLTVTHDGSQGNIYVDGSLLGRASGNITTHSGPINFGGGIGGFDSFLGSLDDLRLYTNCLSPELISLTGYWRFDGGAGLDAADSSIQGHPARLNSSFAWAEGHTGGGVQLGNNQVLINNTDYSVLPASGGSFSLSFWLKPDSLPLGWDGLMNCGIENVNGWSLALESEANQTLLHFCSTNRGGTLDLVATVPAADNVWTKMDITFNGGIATLYANGRKIKESSGAIRGSRSPLVIGSVPGVQNFSGVIDELKIYNRERGASEIGPTAATMWETALWNTMTNLQLQGDGPAGKALTYAIAPIILPTNGNITLSPSSGVVTYSAGSRKGPDAFAYTVSDGEFTSDPAIVSVSVVQPHWLSTNGGSATPFDGSSAEHAWMAGPADALDAIWKTNNYYDGFFYGPGEFQTRGWKYQERSTANAGCKHVGSGSSEPNATTLRLVNAWSTWGEGIIFGTLDGVALCDGFEARHMVLDCNATNVPKYVQGEPAWIRIPLSSTSRVESVKLTWDGSPIYGNAYWWSGRANEFSLCSSLGSANSPSSNCVSLVSTGQVDVISVGTNADELVLQLIRRADDTDFYGLKEIEVVGGTVSIPRATKPDGSESRLSPHYSMVLAVDSDPGTAWASGPETDVQITLPLDHASAVSQINLKWNCKTIVGTGRFGPAATYLIRARDESSGGFYNVPFVSHGRTSNGLETVQFGNAQFTNIISTDQLQIVMTAKEAGVDYYSLKGVSIQNGTIPTKMRLPVAAGSLNWGNFEVMRAFDNDPSTQWASDTQGMVGAADLAGNNMKFCGLKVIGFGTKAARECFPMGIMARWSGQPRALGNILVSDCTFAQPAPANADGITTVLLAAFPPNTLTNAIVRRCSVLGLKSHFAYSDAFTTTHVENCLVDDCGVGVYFEPNPENWDNIGRPVLVRSNQFLNVLKGVYFLMYPASKFDSIICADNEIVLAGAGGWGLAACDTCLPGESGSITNFTALNNVVRYPGWLNRPFSPDGGIGYTDIQNAVFGNNVVALGNPSGLRVRQYPAGLIPPPDPKEDCDHPGPFPPGTPTYPASLDTLLPGYRRAWFNNRDVQGSKIEVRFTNFGADGPAAEQQWGD